MTQTTPKIDAVIRKYNFAELVFDATLAANDRILGTVAIALVSVDYDKESILTQIFRHSHITAENRQSAIHAMTPNPYHTYYLIGGDILDV